MRGRPAVTHLPERGPIGDIIGLTDISEEPNTLIEL